jgi:hypothetical protein
MKGSPASAAPRPAVTRRSPAVFAPAPAPGNELQTTPAPRRPAPPAPRASTSAHRGAPAAVRGARLARSIRTAPCGGGRCACIPVTATRTARPAWPAVIFVRQPGGPLGARAASSSIRWTSVSAAAISRGGLSTKTAPADCAPTWVRSGGARRRAPATRIARPVRPAGASATAGRCVCGRARPALPAPTMLCWTARRRARPARWGSPSQATRRRRRRATAPRGAARAPPTAAPRAAAPRAAATAESRDGRGVRGAGPSRR